VRKVAILGGTRGMGKALARRLAERGDAVCLLGRDAGALERMSKDLAARSPSGKVATAACDLLDTSSYDRALDAAERALEGLDTVVITAALFADQQDLEASEELRERLLRADFTNTLLLCERVRERLLARGGGTLCVFSSVAGDRARTPVRLYGAAKAGLSHYLEGLDHAYRSRGLVTVCVKPGFVRTEMTAHLTPPPFAGDPDTVAAIVQRAIDRGTPVVYAPAIWRWVLWVIRRLPRTVMRRIQF